MGAMACPGAFRFLVLDSPGPTQRGRVHSIPGCLEGTGRGSNGGVGELDDDGRHSHLDKNDIVRIVMTCHDLIIMIMVSQQ